MANGAERLKQLAEKTRLLNKMSNDGVFDYLLKEIPDRIRTRTRLGKGLLGTLKELSPKYVRFRKTFDELSPDATANRSNLTLTGRMLDTITAIRKGTIFTFSFKDEPERRKAKWADETGRPFFDLLPTEEKAIRRDIKKIIKDKITSLFTG